MKNFEIARAFEEIADLLELKEENIFRIRAYRRAAQNIESLAEDIASVATRGALEQIPGIGKDLALKIQEYLKTGRMNDLEELRQEVPKGVVELMNLQSVGPKTAKLLYEKLQVDSVEKLEALARAGTLVGLPGIREKKQEDILRGIELWKKGQERMPLGKALPLAKALVAALKDLKEVQEIEVAGSLRRWKETIGDIDILVASSKPAKVMGAFVNLPGVQEVLLQGETKSSIRHVEGIQVDLRVLEPGAFGAALQYFTGSKQHNIRVRDLASRKGLKVSEYGVFDEKTGGRIAGETEEEVYEAVGLPFIPPELREDTGEVEVALEGKLPRLIQLSDIKGDLHAHTNWSDGHHPLEELIEAAYRKGYRYMIVSDHSRSQTVAGGLTAERLLDQVKKLRALQKRYKHFRILAGCECDTLADGRMDFSDEVLSQLDIVLAAVHSRFKQSKEEMTRRIIAALKNPYVNILVHPTGRLIGERAPYEVDLEAVFQVARAEGKAVEINSSPQRLDLNDLHARRAKEMGVRISIDTDTHFLDHLGNIAFGVAVARRAWIEKGDVVNTMPLQGLLQWAHRGRKKRA
ncbi:MAG: DNA polymerase/3'-5' exonuclease PolX [candidate division NC10 bacterium]|nr:DNA polymerase/3'-5' exonuclease PolX [candidate division NC10 bacterium]